MEMSDRVKEIRSFKGMNQADFAKLLGIGQSTLAMMEVSKRKISERHIKTICSLCNIAEHWLRTGEGSMEAPNQTATVVDLLQRSFESLDDYDKQVIASWIQATPEERTAIKQFFDRLKSLQSSEAAQTEHSATIAIRPAANDDHVPREAAHRMRGKQFDDKEKGTI